MFRDNKSLSMDLWRKNILLQIDIEMAIFCTTQMLVLQTKILSWPGLMVCQCAKLIVNLKENDKGISPTVTSMLYCWNLHGSLWFSLWATSKEMETQPLWLVLYYRIMLAAQDFLTFILDGFILYGLKPFIKDTCYRSAKKKNKQQQQKLQTWATSGCFAPWDG